MSDEETIAYSMKEEEGPARETAPAGPPERGKNGTNTGERRARGAREAMEAQAGEDILLPLHHLQQDTVALGVRQAAVG